MLILRRKAGESLVIGDDIRIAVLDINEGSVRLAIDAPKRIPILRSELLQAVDANRDAAGDQSSPQALIRILKKRPRPGAGTALTTAVPATVFPGALGGENNSPLSGMENNSSLSGMSNPGVQSNNGAEDTISQSGNGVADTVPQPDNRDNETVPGEPF